MHFTKKTVSEKKIDFIKKLQSKKLLRFPGAYNPLCAKLIAEIGFDGVYVSGGVMSNDLGLPDIGLTTLEQVSYRSGQISRVTDLPTIVDIDTGFGNCKKTIEEFEKKGLAGCHLEDQIPEKRCGHLDNKELVSKEEMIKKIKEFIKSNNLNKRLIYKKKIEKNDFYFANIKAKDIDLIAEFQLIIPEALKEYSWKKSMKWANYDLNWGRPLRSIVALFNNKILNFNFYHLKSSCTCPFAQ